MEAQVPREDGNPPPLEQEVTIPEGVPKENVYSQSLTDQTQTGGRGSGKNVKQRV